MNSSGAAPVPPSLPSTTMKSGRISVSSIALQIARNSQGWPMQSLKPAGLPPDSARSSRDEGHHLERRRKCAVARRREAILARFDAADRGDFLRDLGGRQHAAMAGLGALAELDFDHLDLVVGGRGGEFFRIECRRVAAAEIAGADFPDDVAAVLAVIGAEAALAGVVREAAGAAPVQRADGVGAERAETHRRDIEHRRRIGLLAIRAADGDAKRLGRDRPSAPSNGASTRSPARRRRPGCRTGACRAPSWRVDRRAALVARERQAVLLALEEILPHLRADFFQQEAQMRGDRIVAQHRVALLREIAKAEQRKGAEHNGGDGERHIPVAEHGPADPAQTPRR